MILAAQDRLEHAWPVVHQPQQHQLKYINKKKTNSVTRVMREYSELATLPSSSESEETLQSLNGEGWAIGVNPTKGLQREKSS